MAAGQRAARADPGDWVFRNATRSPEPAPPDPELAFCGPFDGALGRVAARLARRAARSNPDMDTEELSFGLRAEGDPHPWPEAWTFGAAEPTDPEARRRAEAWLSSLHVTGERRCGVGRATDAAGSRVVALVVVGALADLAPIPTRARLGQWIAVRATLLVDAENAKVVVLPPRGLPRAMPTTLHGRSVEAAFSVDMKGPWLMQLVGSVSEGPRPLLEAALFVDEDPPSRPGEGAAPGEGSPGQAGDDRALLGAMVNAARGAEGIGTLDSSADLDRIAQAHAEAMRDARKLAHDAGDGTPLDRLRAAGIEPSRPGENVAHATSLARAHRVLWASPSHRENVLDPSFGKLGVGVAHDTDGSVWVCELFTDSFRAGILRRRLDAY